MRIEKITGEQTLPLRQMVLRPGLPLSESIFTCDAREEAGHFAALDDTGKIVAVGTVYREACSDKRADERMRNPKAWRLRGMATDEKFRGQGLGAKVLQACLEHARKNGADNVWCNARVGACEFYLRHGFVKMSELFEMPGIGPHYLMKHDFKDLIS